MRKPGRVEHRRYRASVSSLLDHGEPGGPNIRARSILKHPVRDKCAGAARSHSRGRQAANRRQFDGASVRFPTTVVLLARRRGEATGKPVPLLVLRPLPADRDSLLSVGQPFVAPRAGRGRIGVLLHGDTGWAEIRTLVTDSYQVIAPEKLTALLHHSETHPTDLTLGSLTRRRAWLVFHPAGMKFLRCGARTAICQQPRRSCKPLVVCCGFEPCFCAQIRVADRGDEGPVSSDRATLKEGDSVDGL
jgi:hypothetical protein